MQIDFRCKLLLVLLLLLFVSGTALADKPTPRVQKLTQTEAVQVMPKGTSPAFRTGDTCTVNLAGDPAWYIFPWVIGDELYKAYQDPSVTCDKPYPFTVDIIHLPLVVLDSATFYISVDIETADLSDPSCPKPGSLLVISPYYEITLPSDFYLISFPLDTPAVVNGPYFAGVYFGEAGNADYTAIVTDSFPTPCVGYNDWGEGYVDLDTVHSTETGEKIFPGRLIIYTAGTTGGSSGTEPEPAAQFIIPTYNQSLGAMVDLWAHDAAGSAIIDRVEFQFRSGMDWFDIGFDTDDESPLRNGVIASGSGDGLSYKWNTSGLEAGNYHLNCTITDTLGRSSIEVVTVSIDPTVPIPEIENPIMGQNVCDGITATISSPNSDIVYAAFEYKSIPVDFTLPIPIFSQQLGGDIDDDPNDGNPVAEGEYGEYCSGPAVAAMAIKYWYNQGYTDVLTESGSVVLTDAQLMDRLFEAMNIAENLGAYDEELIAGLRSYNITHGNQLVFDINRSPDAIDLFNWMGNEQHVVMVGVTGDPGLWMTTTGSTGLTDPSGQYRFKMVNPIDGVISEYKVKEEAGKLWLLYNASWSEIDILVGVIPYDWHVYRAAIGVDAVGADGWSYDWDTQLLSSDSLYFLHVEVADQFGKDGYATVLVQIDCSVNGVPGDINHDGEVNAADIVYMTNFLYLHGAPPPGGYATADVNCDSFIDLSDVIYLYNYLFNSGPPPCP
jgi:hypothetical protein